MSKRTDAPYRSRPSRAWLKSKNPASEAVRKTHNPPKLNNAWWRCTRTENCNPPVQDIRPMLAKVAWQHRYRRVLPQLMRSKSGLDFEVVEK